MKKRPLGGRVPPLDGKAGGARIGLLARCTGKSLTSDGQFMVRPKLAIPVEVSNSIPIFRSAGDMVGILRRFEQDAELFDSLERSLMLELRTGGWRSTTVRLSRMVPPSKRYCTRCRRVVSRPRGQSFSFLIPTHLQSYDRSLTKGQAVRGRHRCG